MSERVWGAIGHYMKAKFEADRDLVRENGRRGLEYTIVRPGGLRDEEGTGRIEAGKVHFGERMIAREVSCFFFFFSFSSLFSFSGRGPYDEWIIYHDSTKVVFVSSFSGGPMMNG